MLYEKLVTIYPELRTYDMAFGDIQLQDDGAGPYIKEWNHPTLPRPTQEQIDAATPADLSIPLTVSMRQARLALSQSGLLSAVNVAMEAATEADQIEWEYATTVERYSPLVLNMAMALGLGDAEIDDLLRLAGTL